MFLWVSSKCPICGKEFYPTRKWVYKKEGVTYCSWTCYRRATKDEKKPEAQIDGESFKLKNSGCIKPVLKFDQDNKLLNSYKSAEHAARSNDCNDDCVRKACRTGKLYKGFYWRYE